MTTYIKILNRNDIKVFDTPPTFNNEERKYYFYLPKWAHDIILNFRTLSNKIGFILQLGYFKDSKKFYNAKNFNKEDLDYIINSFDFDFKEANLKNYKARTYRRHKEIILKNLGQQKFDKNIKKKFVSEADKLVKKQFNPRLIFLSLIGVKVA